MKKLGFTQFETLTVKFLEKMVRIGESLMKGQPDVESAIQSLTTSVTALTAALAALAKPQDLSPQIDEISALKEKVDLLTTQVNAQNPPPPAPNT